MDRYICFRDIYEVVKSVEYENENSAIAMLKLLKILQSAHGRFILIDTLLFIGEFDFLDRKWSTSVIGSDAKGEQVEKEKTLLNKINEELACVNWLINHINDEFEGWDDIYISVFYERYFLNTSIQDITLRFGINNRKYYIVIENAEFLVKRGWQLTKISPQLIEIALSD